MNKITKMLTIFASIALIAPAVGFAQGKAVIKKADAKPTITKPKGAKSIGTIKQKQKAKKLANSKEGKLLKKRADNRKAIKQIQSDRAKKMKALEKVRTRQKAKAIKAGKKLDKATQIKNKEKKSDGAKK